MAVGCSRRTRGVSWTLTSPSRGVASGGVVGGVEPGGTVVGDGVVEPDEPDGLVVAGVVDAVGVVLDGTGMAVGTGSARLSSLQAAPARASGTTRARSCVRRLIRPPG
jgi:hypothetical protein